MKKTFTRILAILLAFVCLFTLVSCAKPKLDLEKAKDNLEAKEYFVSYNDDTEDEGTEAVLYAYNGDYSVTIMKFETIKLAKLYQQAWEMKIEQKIEELRLTIKTSKHILNKFEDELDSDEIDYYKDTISSAKEDIEELKEELNNIGRSGKYVWKGDAEAFKATK